MNDEPNDDDGAAKPARKPGNRGPGAQRRSNSRRLAMQALYQLQLNPQPWQDIHLQFTKDEEFAAADADYFRELLKESA